MKYYMGTGMVKINRKKCAVKHSTLRRGNVCGRTCAAVYTQSGAVQPRPLGETE